MSKPNAKGPAEIVSKEEEKAALNQNNTQPMSDHNVKKEALGPNTRR
ncbi:hypothetical protein ACS3UN_07225 [Oscillospiraceae bacterium LTW-04]|nr:hypothetical protein RBH76_03120 [Oscillospiraceae bacterium MB24-C1]